jgi:parallel beta-helix repeat protein
VKVKLLCGLLSLAAAAVLLGVLIVSRSVSSEASTPTTWHVYPLTQPYVWAKTYDGGWDDFAQSVALDSQDNIIVGGLFWNGQAESWYYHVMKLDADCDSLWDKSWDSGRSVGDPLTENFEEYGIAVAVDSQDNVLATSMQHTGPQHPGLWDPNTDRYLVKYSPEGTVLWEKTYDSGARDTAGGVAADSWGNILATGTSSVGGIAVADTFKYTPTGIESWHAAANHAPNWTRGSAVAVDSQNNVIVTGKDQNDVACTIKYDPDGNELWSRIDPSFCPVDVAIDSRDDIFISGVEWAGATTDYHLSKYDPAGNDLWVLPGVYDSGYHEWGGFTVAVDSQDNAVMTGMSYMTDAPQGPLTREQIVALLEHADFCTLKYDGDGIPVWWKQTYDSGLPDVGGDVAVDSQGDIVVLGTSFDGTSFNYRIVKHLGTLPIQGAVDAAAPGDTVLVHPGTYHEHIGIDKQLVLESTGGAAATIIDGQGLKSPLVSSDKDGLTIRGFTIRNAGAADGQSAPPPAAIILSASRDCVIEANVLTGNGGGLYVHGFGAEGSNEIRDNEVSGSREGIVILSSLNNIISDNVIRDCGNAGILLIGGFVDMNEDGQHDWGGPPEGLPCDGNQIVRNEVYGIGGVKELEVGIVAMNCKQTVIGANEVFGAGGGIGVMGGDLDFNGSGYAEMRGVSEKNKIANNDIHDNESGGISAGSNGSGDTVSGNHVHHNGQVAHEAPGYQGPYGGLHIGGLSMTVEKNMVDHNWGFGIALGEPRWAGGTAQGAVVRDNTIEANGLGIIVLGDECRVSENKIGYNTGPGPRKPDGVEIRGGIYLGSGDTAPTGNVICLNNIVGNSPQACSFALPGSGNSWNSTEQMTYVYGGNTYTNCLGNYWSDYGSSEANDDGIGDSPYSIDGSADYYPLMQGFENYMTAQVWTLPSGLDENPMAMNQYQYPADAAQVTLADLALPEELLVVWHDAGPGVGWKWFRPGWPESTLATLDPGKYYIGIVSTATEWEISQ